MGLDAERVILPDNTTSIGSRAFADCPRLKFVVIHADTIVIAADAFDGCDDVTIISSADSDARSWAETHGINWQGLR